MFNIDKIIQIVSYILKKNHNKINYTKLIKLLYIADKKTIENYDFTITGDEYYSLKNGPVLSTTYDLIRQKSNISNQLKWDSVFLKNGYNIEFKSKYDKHIFDKLSQIEIDVIDEVCSKYKSYSYEKMIDETHKKDLFPEVKWDEADKSNTSMPIALNDILKSIGRNDSEIDYIISEIQSQENEFKLFSGL